VPTGEEFRGEIWPNDAMEGGRRNEKAKGNADGHEESGGGEMAQWLGDFNGPFYGEVTFILMLCWKEGNEEGIYLCNKNGMRNEK
jgi:hypothetical protein